MLEQRVQERTAELTRANQALQAEAAERQRTEEALRESESMTRAIVESAQDAIIAMDHHGRITEFNPAAEKMFGHARPDVIGRVLADVIVPPRYASGIAAPSIATWRPANLVCSARGWRSPDCADGSEFPIELTLALLVHSAPPAFTAHLRDITERRRPRPPCAIARRGFARSSTALSMQSS